MSANPPLDRSRFGVGFQSELARSREAAWRRNIGTSRIAARFELLPDEERRWDRLGISALLQLSVLTFFVALPIFFPERLAAIKYQVTPLEWLVTEVPVAPPPPAPKAPKITPKPKPDPIEEVKLEPKKPHIFVQEKVFAPQMRTIEAKAPEVITPTTLEAAKLSTPINQPKRPREEVKLNNINSGSAAPATLKNMPLDKVQTGGFGDPNGLAGKGNPNKGTNINRLGSPALPGGDGYGNGTGGAKGVRGTVASAGFGNGVAIPPASTAKHGPVQSAGLVDESAVTAAPKKKAMSSDSPTTTVDILDKPRPQYTQEGRTLRIEGDVVLDVVFLANGTVQVNGVVKGLGHGLDQSAIRAAQQIKFKPAKRDSEPVDFPARVRIEFRLAY
jgi:TonB family protein